MRHPPPVLILCRRVKVPIRGTCHVPSSPALNDLKHYTVLTGIQAILTRDILTQAPTTMADTPQA
jgi:hypothetical protein